MNLTPQPPRAPRHPLEMEERLPPDLAGATREDVLAAIAMLRFIAEGFAESGKPDPMVIGLTALRNMVDGMRA